MYSERFLRDRERIDSLLAEPLRADAALERVEHFERPTLADAAALLQIHDDDRVQRVLAAAARVTDGNHGRRVGMIAPLYFSDICWNDCTCCDMSSTNKAMRRRTLELDEYQAELQAITSIGYRTVEIVGGGFPLKGKLGRRFLSFVEHGRKIVPNFAFFVDTLAEAEYREFAGPDITIIHWQETYQEDGYRKMVRAGPKTDFSHRLNVHDYWLRAGGAKFGLSVLAGVSSDFRKDVALMLSHALYLEEEYGRSPTCFGTVRIQPIKRKDLDEFTKVPDRTMWLATAIYRLMFPSANIIATSREEPEVVANQLRAGATFTNASCTTVVGGYTEGKHQSPEECGGQFEHGSPTPEQAATLARSQGKSLDWEKPL